MVVSLRVVGGVNVIVRAVVARVIMVVDRRVPMIMIMFVLVTMLVRMSVCVFMGVSLTSMGMSVCMAVSMLVRMQVLMFMISVHRDLLS